VTLAFNPAAFEQLAQDLGSYAIASEFVMSFESLLAERIQRIERALKNQDREEAITALLSLQASAAMAGAHQLHASATNALTIRLVETTPPGPLTRKLQGQANLFTHAFADFHHTHTTQSTPLDKLG
jgi:hypothetical protein